MGWGTLIQVPPANPTCVSLKPGPILLILSILSDADNGLPGAQDPIHKLLETIEDQRDPLLVPTGVDADRKSTRLNSSHIQKSRMPSSA